MSGAARPSAGAREVARGARAMRAIERARSVVTLGLVVLGLAVGRAYASPVEATLERSRIAVGESSTLVVAVEGNVDQPRLDLPEGLMVLASGREQRFSWVNGKSSSQTLYRYEIGANAPGHYAIGPVQVHTTAGDFRSSTLALEVTATPEHLGGRAPAGDRGPEPATLSVTLEPSRPYVGQMVVLRARLLQRAAFTEDPQYTPPTTTGFWTDKPSAPESFYGDEHGRRVLVTETRMRMFPLAGGHATIGEASAHVAVAGGDPQDPLGWLSGGGRRDFVLRSHPIDVAVRPLPPGAPAGYGGAVGDLSIRWEADRASTPRDVPVTLRLMVRGRGNLPLIQAPTFDPGDVEVFAATSDDSLGAPGSEGPGRKQFQWTVLPRHDGTLTLAAPLFATFDPASGGYRVLSAEPIRIEVGPPAFAGGAGGGGFPAELIENPVDDSGRRPQPWGWLASAGLFGIAIALWRSAGRRPKWAPERARALEWLRALGTAQGPDFWRAAEDSLAWLQSRGDDVAGIGAEVARARYAATGADPSRVQRVLVERVSQALPPAPAAAAWRLGAMVVAVCAVAVGVVLGLSPAGNSNSTRLSAAEAAARRGDVDRARALWTDAWHAGTHRPELAARLAWASVQQGDLGHSSAWVLRGRRLEPRDPALDWVAGRVRDGGGLLGAPRERLPVRSLEWSILAALFALAAGIAWPHRRVAAALAALGLLAALWPVGEDVLTRARPLAVVTRAVTVGSDDVELQPGQVVRTSGRDGDAVRISAGRALSGRVRPDAIEVVGSTP